MLRNCRQHSALLDSAKGYPRGLEEDARQQATVELASFLGLAGFGEEEIPYEAGRLDYFRKLHALNPWVFSLRTARDEIRVELRHGNSVKTWDLGRVAGYSCVIPTTAAGFQAFIAADDNEYTFGSEFLCAGETKEICPTSDYIFIEGFFDFESYDRDVIGRSVLHVLKHVSRFLPAKEFEIRDGTVHRWNGGPLPTIFCAGNGSFHEELMEDLGFRSVTFDPERLLNQRKFVFDANVLNHPETETIDNSRRTAMLEVFQWLVRYSSKGRQ